MLTKKSFGADVQCCSPFIPSIHLHRMVVLYCTEDLVLYKESSVFGFDMYMPTILANQMQERKAGRWPFLYSSENRNQYWMAVIVRADYPVQNQPAELGELGRKCCVYSIDSLADMMYLKQCIAFSGDFKQQMTNISSLMNN